VAVRRLLASVTSTFVATSIQTCYQHTDRRAGVQCQRCDRPICPSCMRQASVGFHCPECTKANPQRVVSARTLGNVRPVAALAIIALNLAVFVADIPSTTDALDGIGTIGRDWALNGPDVAAGDVWRPLTAGFVHAGLMHVGFNMFLLWQLGRLLEPAVRWYGFVVLYVMSLLGGSLLVLVLDPDSFTVGASGAVFGLMAATFVAMRSRGIDPFSTGIGPLLVINLVLTFAVPGISIGGHLGGLVTGAAGGWLLWVWGPRLGREARMVPVGVCAVLALALYGGCLVVA
jgi:membrane associated rhomboid family serine protease